MSDQNDWVASWLPVEVRAPIRHTSNTPTRVSKSFHGQKDAVSFAMGLDVDCRGSAQLHLPGGQVVNLPIIEQMHAAQQ